MALPRPLQRRDSPATTAEPSAPSADLLYSNGLRDLNGKKYDLAMQEFHDYLKYYSAPTWPRTRSSTWARSPTRSSNIDQAVDAYSKVIDNYPKSFKLAPAHLKKGLALVATGTKDLRACANCAPWYACIRAPKRNGARGPS